MVKSIISDKKQCYLTGSYLFLEKHHVIPGTANRKKADRYGLFVWLNRDVHRYLHGSHGAEKLRELKQVGQRKFEELYSRELWMQTFHHNYLEDEDA